MQKIPVLTYSRVSGYYNPIQNFNRGKKEEYRERKYIKVPAELLQPEKVETWEERALKNVSTPEFRIMFNHIIAESLQ